MRATFAAACILLALAMIAWIDTATARNPLALGASPRPAAIWLVSDGEHEQVAKAQHALQGLGLYNGTTNGTLGPQTRRALSDYQRKLRLPETGVLDGRTSLALAHREMVDACVERNIPIAECLDALSEFQSFAVPPAAPVAPGNLAAERTCRNARVMIDCLDAEIRMNEWLGSLSATRR